MGKSGVLEHNSGNISETRKHRRKVTMEGLQGLTNALSNDTTQNLSLLSQERVYELQIWPEYSLCSIQRKVIKNVGEKEAWAYPKTVLIFGVPPIISGTGKATNIKFCTHIRSINRKKNPLKISGKVSLGIVNDSRKFSGHPYIRRIAQSSLR